MKKIFKMAILGVSLLFTSCTTTPSDYFDSITLQIKNIANAERVLANGADSTKAVDAQKAIAKAYKKLRRMEDFRGNDSLRAAALEYAKFFNDLYCSGQNHLLNLEIKQSNGIELTPEEVAEQNVLFQNYLNGSTELNYKVSKAETDFLKHYELIVDQN